MLSKMRVIIKGGGDLATAVAHKLFRAGFPVLITEISQPMVVRRSVAFANCVYEKEWTVEGVTAKLANGIEEAEEIMKGKMIPVFIDPECRIRQEIQPTVIVDAILAKKNCGTELTDAPIVIGLGPGFTAGEDVHAVIETQRGHNLGRVILQGKAAPNTGIPGNIGGYAAERVFRAPCQGVVTNYVEIGSRVMPGDILCWVDGWPVTAEIGGIVRGIIHDGIRVEEKEKLGDIDPRGIEEYCYTISDKGRTIAGGVMEVIFYLSRDLGLRTVPDS